MALYDDRPVVKVIDFGVAKASGGTLTEKTIPPLGNTRIPEAIDRLIELYTATNKPDEAKKDRELRAKYRPEPALPPKAVK